MMDDPEDKKPEGWVEEKRIVDANAPLLKGSEVKWVMRSMAPFVTAIECTDMEGTVYTKHETQSYFSIDGSWLAHHV